MTSGLGGAPARTVVLSNGGATRSAAYHGRMPAPSLGQAYLDRLSDDDLVLLARAGRLEPGDLGRAVSRLRRDGELLERSIADAATQRALLEVAEDEVVRLAGMSPFLLFALAVHRVWGELAQVRFVQEWAGPRQRLPVFSVDELRDFLADPGRRLFLSELLASYTHVSSGALWSRTRNGWRRQRFSELDPARLASLLPITPHDQQAGVYRRLGDLALFLTGVFPDHTASRPLRPLDVQRLARDMDAAGREELGEALAVRGVVGLFEYLGRRWYLLAAQTPSPPASRGGGILGEVADRFGDARRVLNYLTDRHLFSTKPQLFPLPDA